MDKCQPTSLCEKDGESNADGELSNRSANELESPMKSANKSNLVVYSFENIKNYCYVKVLLGEDVVLRKLEPFHLLEMALPYKSNVEAQMVVRDMVSNQLRLHVAEYVSIPFGMKIALVGERLTYTENEVQVYVLADPGETVDRPKGELEQGFIRSFQFPIIVYNQIQFYDCRAEGERYRRKTSVEEFLLLKDVPAFADSVKCNTFIEKIEKESDKFLKICAVPASKRKIVIIGERMFYIRCGLVVYSTSNEKKPKKEKDDKLLDYVHNHKNKNVFGKYGSDLAKLVKVKTDRMMLLPQGILQKAGNTKKNPVLQNSKKNLVLQNSKKNTIRLELDLNFNGNQHRYPFKTPYFIQRTNSSSIKRKFIRPNWRKVRECDKVIAIRRKRISKKTEIQLLPGERKIAIQSEKIFNKSNSALPSLEAECNKYSQNPMPIEVDTYVHTTLKQSLPAQEDVESRIKHTRNSPAMKLPFSLRRRQYSAAGYRKPYRFKQKLFVPLTISRDNNVTDAMKGGIYNKLTENLSCSDEDMSTHSEPKKTRIVVPFPFEDLEKEENRYDDGVDKQCESQVVISGNVQRRYNLRSTRNR